jgi:hypothetical protein
VRRVEYEVRTRRPWAAAIALPPAPDRVSLPVWCEGELRVHRGQDLVKTYESHLAPRVLQQLRIQPLRRSHAVYCGRGSDADLDLRPSFHQQVAYKASWHEIGDDAPQFAEMPPG